MTAFGSARALYHVEAADTSAARGRKGVNYSRGRRIDIATAAHSKVQTVDIVGTADGVYLEPLPPPRDTTRARADSTRSPAADTTRARAGAPGAAPDTGAPATPAPPPPAGPARPPGRGRP